MILAISMTQGWMIGIMAMMGLFGISAAIFSKKGKDQNK